MTLKMEIGVSRIQQVVASPGYVVSDYDTNVLTFSPSIYIPGFFDIGAELPSYDDTVQSFNTAIYIPCSEINA